MYAWNELLAMVLSHSMSGNFSPLSDAEIEAAS
jgi:hypothetical protein